MHRFLAVCSLLFLLPFSVRAADPTFISEVAWAGSSASIADEWFELCGPPETDLSGWSIEGASASPIVLPDGSVVPISGAFLIANYPGDEARSTLAAAPNLVTTSVALSNSRLLMTLRDAGGVSVDTAGALDAAPFAGASGDAKASMERLDAALDGGTAAAWASASTSIGFDLGATEFGTPGACVAPMPLSAPIVTDPSPTPSATSSDETPPVIAAPAPSSPTSMHVEPMSAVRISEIYPSPNSGEHEWIELVNPSNLGEFLDDWAVEDATGTKTRLSGLLLPWARFIIESPKGSLNNDGDLVVLKDKMLRIVDRVEYPKTRKGAAFMRAEFQDAFVMTLTPTRGAANVFTSTEEAVEMTPIVTVPDPAPQSVILSKTKDPSLERDPSTPLRSDQDDKKGSEDAPTLKLVPKPAVKTVAKKTVKPKAAGVSKYKGDAYAATIVVPPGVYAKTRAYIQRGETIEELRFSTSPGAVWEVGDRVSFVAQTKSEGAISFLLANPNSVRKTGSASATFAAAEAWPNEAGGYSFTAEVASIRGSAVEVKLGGVEGDVLAPSGSVASLKPGDTIRVEGFIAPGARPQVVLPYEHSLRLFKPYLPDDSSVSYATNKLPVLLTVGLTLAAAAVGLVAYLRMQRLKRLALTQAPIEDGAWE